MLNIGGIGLLARLLGTNPGYLSTVAEFASSYCTDLILIDPAKPEKQRPIVSVTGPLRKYQNRLFRVLLAPNHRPSSYSHGGVRGRNIKTNVRPHLGSTFVYTTDIANFYPSVHYTQIYRLFVDRFGCSPDVARICTKLCTHRHHLAQGLVTSPILADCIMSVADYRIGTMCAKSGLIYTRFVDDIAISASYPVDSGSFPRLVKEILGSCGLRINAEKEDKGRISDGKYITKLWINRGKLDVRPRYLDEIYMQLRDAARLAEGGEWVGTYHTPNQIRSRIEYIAWINPGRRRALMKRYRAILWNRVQEEALHRGLLAPKKKVAVPPGCSR
jgi:hypothetical protein